MYAMKRMNNDMAVSPIVATLVLIVVAVIGAVAVGTIMGTFSTSVSKNVNANQANSASQTEILVAGSTTVAPITQAAGAIFSAQNPGVKIDNQATGSGAGIQAVGSGVADIGASSDGVSASQMAQFPQLQSTLIGYGAIVPIEYIDNTAGDDFVLPATNSANPLTIGDLKALFDPGLGSSTTVTSGDMTDAPVVVYRADSSGTAKTLQGFLTGVLTPSGIAGLSQWTNVGDAYNSTAVAVNGNQAMIQTIETTKDSVGYADYGDAVNGVSSGNVWILAYTDNVGNSGAGYQFVQPNSTTNTLTAWNNLKSQAHNEYKYLYEAPGAFSSSNLKYSNYTLLRQLFYVTNGAPSSSVQTFINFVKNDPRDPNSAQNWGIFQETNNFGIPDVS
jgi:phosphate transport system substrate-binding protein